MSKRSQDFKKDIVFRTIEWGFKKQTFTETELLEGLGLYPEDPNNDPFSHDRLILKKHFRYSNEIWSGLTISPGAETIFVCSAGQKYSLTVEAKFKYIDFLELELARKNSESAQKNARIAQKNSQVAQTLAQKSLNVAIIACAASIIVPLIIELVRGY